MFKKIFILFAFLFIVINSYSQASWDTVNVSPLEICLGDSVYLYSNGSQSVTLMGNDFNGGSIGAGWSSNSAQFDNPCNSTGDNWDGTTYLWVGPMASFPRDLTTVGFDVTSTCEICFDFKMATQGVSSPCEGPDEEDEGVSLQWSTDGGITWTDIVYFSPDGATYPSNAWIGSGTSVNNNVSDDFNSWANYCYTVPAAAVSSNTMFNWHQEQVTAAGNDHWGIDNVFIHCPSPAVSITWDETAGGSFISSEGEPGYWTPTVSTTINALIDDGNGSDLASFNVVVYPPPTLNITGLNASYCYQEAAVTMSGTPTGGTFSGTGVSGNQFDPGTAGIGGPYTITYTWDQWNAAGTEILCTFTTTTTVTVTNGPSADFTVVSPVCENELSTITYTGTGTAAGTYSWNFGGMSVSSGSNSGPYQVYHASAATYTITLDVSEGGCSSQTTQTILVNSFPSANAGADDAICGLTYNMAAIASIGTGTWSLVSGPGTASFSSVNSASSSVTVTAYGTYTFNWNENSNTCEDDNQVQITFWEVPTPNAGLDDAICGNNYTLAGTASVGTGTWTSSPISGFTNNHLVTTATTSSSFGVHVYTWTEVNGICTASDDVSIEYIEIPVANAGTDNTVCGPNDVLNANPSVGTGVWTVNPATITFSSNNPNSPLTANVYGTYTFTWTETNQMCTDNDDVQITFIEIPTPNAGVDDNICGPDYTLNAVSSIGTSTWTVNPPSASIANPSSASTGTTAGLYGTYTFTFTENNNGCITSDDVDITYYQIPTADFVTSVINCYQEQTTLIYTGNASGSATYNWNFDGGNAVGGGQGPVYVSWDIPNTYSPSLQVTENGCISPIITNTVINPEELISSAVSTDILCFGDADGTATVTYSGGTVGSGGYSVTWNDPDTTHTDVVTGLSGNNYSVLVVDAMGCETSSYVTIDEPTQLVLAPIENFTVCNGSNVLANALVTGGVSTYSYTWDGIQSANNGFNLLAFVNSTHSLLIEDMNGCKDSLFFTISVTPPVNIELYVNIDSVCPGDPVLVTANVWGGVGPPYKIIDPYTGDIVSPPLLINVNEDGLITLVVEDGCKSKDTSSVLVNVYPLPPNDFYADRQSGCQPFLVNFVESNVQDGQLYIWDFGDNSSDNLSQGKNPYHIYNIPGMFDVTLTVISKEGCKSIVTQQNYINVFPKPEAQFLYNPLVATIVDPEVVFTNLSTHLYSSYWYFGDGDSSNVKDPVHNFPDVVPDTYQTTLIAVSANGCKDTAIAFIPLKPVPMMYGPNAFSPDKDRLNDNFYVTGVGVDASKFWLQIYDRWGELIWETREWDSDNMISGKWNGKAKDGEKTAQIGVYKWKVTWYDIDGNEHIKIGLLTLIK